MSKYIDLMLALNKLWKLCVEDIDAEKSESETFDFSRARDALSALPTIEISEDCENCKHENEPPFGTICGSCTKANSENYEPKVSEDAISREDAIKAYNEAYVQTERSEE